MRTYAIYIRAKRFNDVNFDMTSRREFVKTGAATLGLSVLGPRATKTLAALGASASAAPMDAGVKSLLMDALNAAKMAGAGYADARVGHYRNNFVITREKQIKGGSRAMKLALIEAANPTWRDLYEEIL